MNNLAIIPARGGSKRIPRKNIKLFHGKPIIAYSIEKALKSNLFEEVMVSTDDEEIAEIASKYGAKVPFYRSKETSDDFATTMQVISEVISEYKGNMKKMFDLVCCIYPTSPMIKLEHLKQGLDLLIQKDLESVFPIVAFSYPIWRGLEIINNDKIRMVWPKYQTSRSQDLKKVYHDAGQWYWMKSNISGETVFTDNSASIILSEQEVQDIDNLNDWKLAEMKYTILFESNISK